MNIDTQYVGGKIQLTFTFDAQEGGQDMVFANAAKKAIQKAIGDLRPDGDEHLINPSLLHALDEKRNALKCLNNAFNKDGKGLRR